MKYKRYRKDFPFSYALGLFPVLELLVRRPELAVEVFVKQQAVDSEGGRKLQAAARAAGVPLSVNDRQIDALSPKDSCNALAVFSKGAVEVAGLPCEALAGILCLYQPDNMGNLGTILRTAVGFGWRRLALVRPAVDGWDPRVVRASMGAVFQVQLVYFDDWASLAASHGQLPRYALALAPDAVPLGTLELPRACMFVFGNEGAGLPAEVLADCRPLIIPQDAGVDSFNLGVAAGITLWEHRRCSAQL